MPPQNYATLPKLVPEQFFQIREDPKPVKESHGRAGDRKMSDLYPKYYRAIPPGVDSLDVYAICQMFPVDDPSGAINHARKKLLIPGSRTGGKSMRKDITEARDTLNRWLQLNPEPAA